MSGMVGLKATNVKHSEAVNKSVALEVTDVNLAIFTIAVCTVDGSLHFQNNVD